MLASGELCTTMVTVQNSTIYNKSSTVLTLLHENDYLFTNI
jgi:hypothetical protein